MQNSFKNPFEIDEQDTIIRLDPVNASTHSLNNNIAYPSTSSNTNYTKSTTPSLDNDAQISMFSNLKSDSAQQNQSQLNQFDDPPLLQDIGIDIQLIRRRIVAIGSMGDISQQLIQSPDLSGPILIAFALGFLLLLGGKVQFSQILTEFIIGNGVMYILFNFMAKDTDISFYSVTSYLGYSLIPMLILAVFGILFSLNTTFGVLSSFALSAWSSYTAGRMISLALNRQQRKLIVAYPLLLFYLGFALIIIF